MRTRSCKKIFFKSRLEQMINKRLGGQWVAVDNDGDSVDGGEEENVIIGKLVCC